MQKRPSRSHTLREQRNAGAMNYSQWRNNESEWRRPRERRTGASRPLGEAGEKQTAVLSLGGGLEDEEKLLGS